MQIGQYTGIGVLASGHKFIVENAAANANNYFTFGSLSGQIIAAGNLAANNNGNNLSGNLYNTGSTLDNKIGYLSGYSDGSFYLKSNPTNYAPSGTFISGITVTGSSTIRGAFNISAGSNITLTQVGSNGMSIASTASGPGGGGVTGVSITGGTSITGILNFQAGSNVTLTQQGNNTLSIAGGAGSDPLAGSSPYLVTGARFYIGSGTPEGVVSACSGSIYTDFFNVLLYQKITGLGNIGWQ